jgi:transposase
VLSLPLPGRIFWCTLPTDMRKSFDTLSGLVEKHLGQDPLSGDLFVFRSKRGDRIKLLWWDTDGLAIWYKRLEEGTFALPSTVAAAAASGTASGAEAARGASDAPRTSADKSGVMLRPAELALLLDGIDLTHVKRQKRYQRLTPTPKPEVRPASE